MRPTLYFSKTLHKNEATLTTGIDLIGIQVVRVFSCVMLICVAKKWEV